MTERVDFYILNEHTDNGRLLLACRLVEKAYNLQHKVYVHTAAEAQAQLLDDLLWTFRQNSFVPHTRYPAAPADRSPVLIGWHPEPALAADVLINLGDDIPAFFENFPRVIELVDQSEAVLHQSRQRFRLYRERGYEPASHRL
jgi:DNA polymerase-3 subunit chi